VIISRAPFRISLGGGGTDLPSYYSLYGGFLIGAGINKYVYLSVNRRFFDSIRLSYSQTEIVDAVDKVQHHIFRETFKFLGIENGIEAVSVADMPSNAGLGSSSCFTVALLNALHAYRREYVTPEQLAEEACHIELDLLKQPIGKQDQYIAAFGGITCLTFDKNGEVFVERLNLPDDMISELQYRLVMFYSGKERDAAEILKEQDRKTKELDPQTTSALHRIKEIGLETRKQLERGRIEGLGELMDEHWQTKKKLSSAISDDFIDECYDTARKNGAAGGKIMGAGGGGFFLFFVDPAKKRQLIDAMTPMGLKHVLFDFDFQGAKIIFNVKP
jgi:D-glycero-alpha-D-manno-heptose-7-phosphate kinase